MKRAAILSHGRPAETAGALEEVELAARRAGVMLVFDTDEAAKHGVTEREGVEVCEHRPMDVDLCIVLGGDGTILKGLRRYARTPVPVFAINFGEVGFLATIDPDGCSEELARAFRSESEVLSLPAIVLDGADVGTYAINDVAIHRKVGERVAKVAYGVDGETVASVRCDGLVVASAAGSTGYNLANGGPVMAWGVEGYVVSFIAPHSLTARPIVVAPNDALTINNGSEAAMEITVDGRLVGELVAGEEIRVRYERDAALLAQCPGSSFYRRLREKFGRLT